MKKAAIVALSLALVAAAARADFQGPAATGGFVSDTEVIYTTDQVGDMRDDTYVIVQGNIIQRVGDEKYTFRDANGTMTVEIDDKDWRGLTVTPTDTVKLYGSVDRGLFKTEIDVDRVEIIQ